MFGTTRRDLTRLGLLFWTAPLFAAAPGLFALADHLRPDPYGEILPVDQVSGAGLSAEVQVTSARAAYASAQLVAILPVAGPYNLNIQTFSQESGIDLTLYREWFHFFPASKQYIPDALIPVSLAVHTRMPDPLDRVPAQTAQAYWLDIWVSPRTPPGDYETRATLHAGGRSFPLSIQVKVLPSLVPSEDVLTIDHNSYGTSWLATQYPRLRDQVGARRFFESPEFFHLIHAYHRIFYEHRGTFHQLGYGHAGKVGPEFAPALSGSGRQKHILDWSLYDQHYGPLLDGSAFAATHRGAKAIPSVYLPINPEWPASFEWWGEPGYEREFRNVVSAMERHFRERGWTHTRFEMFFNHKKRYKGFPWDGDEPRFVEDYPYFKEYARLLKAALPPDSPVQFVFRADASWTMEREWRELAGTIRFWVCAGEMFSWFPYAPELLKHRGDTVWTYGGTPPLTEPASHITLDVLRAWMQNVDGFVRWQTTSPGADPWFHSDGGAEALIYPGDRFGIHEPIPSIRLKLERNALQDLALLGSLGHSPDLRAKVARSYNGTTPADWWSQRPSLADGNPEDWSNADIQDASPVSSAFGRNLDSAAWQRVHQTIYGALEAR